MALMRFVELLTQRHRVGKCHRFKVRELVSYATGRVAENDPEWIALVGEKGAKDWLRKISAKAVK